MPYHPSFYKFSKTLVLAGGCAVLLAGCPKQVNVQGWIPDETLISEVRPHVDNKDSVSQLLGSPSVVATFNDKTWYLRRFRCVYTLR